MKELGLKEKQNLSFDIMCDVHRFCVEHNIKYSLDAGTLLGAIRHKGFIPWDDDFDIMMTRPEFEKFCREFSMDGYKLIAPGNDNCYISFARVCDISRSSAKVNKSPFTSDETGYWIDIFPIDAAPSNRLHFYLYTIIARFFYFVISYYRGFISWRNGELDGNSIGAIKKAKMLLARIGLCVAGNDLVKLITKQQQFLRGRKFSQSKICGSLSFTFNYKREYKRKEWFEDYFLVPYESTEFFVLRGYDEYLKTKFGNYMKLPPEDKRVPPHTHVTITYK